MAVDRAVAHRDAVGVGVLHQLLASLHDSGPPHEPEQEEEWGTGAIPGALLRRMRRAQGLANGIDSVTVKHVSGFNSTLLFKSYEQGRAAWQGETLHGVWFDEEPPMDVYMEGLTRTNATDGIVMITFTPLRGLSDVVRLFLSESDVKALG